MLQLVLCLQEALRAEPLHREAGDKHSYKPMGMVRKAERCPSPSLHLPWAFFTPSSPSRFMAVLTVVSHTMCCWAGSSLRPHNLELTPQEASLLTLTAV